MAIQYLESPSSENRMSAEPAILTTSGFDQRPLAKEEVARHVQRIRQGPARFVMISTGDSTTGSLVLAESEDTRDEPWARQIATGFHPRLHNAALAHQDQSLRDLQRFWDSVTEHTEGLPSPKIRLSTVAQTGARPEMKDQTPEQQMPPIWQVAAEIASQVSDEDWAKVPRDLARNVDHYLYGAPKKKEDA